MQELRNSEFVVEIDKEYEKIYIKYKKSFLPETFKNIVIVGGSYGVLEFIRQFRSKHEYTGQFIVYENNPLQIEDFYTRLRNIFFFNPVQTTKQAKQFQELLKIKIDKKEIKEVNAAGVKFKDKTEIEGIHTLINVGANFRKDEDVTIQLDKAKVIYPNEDQDIKEIKKVLDSNYKKTVFIYGINKRSVQMMDVIRKYTMNKNIDMVMIEPTPQSKTKVFELDFIMQQQKRIFESKIKSIEKDHIHFTNGKQPQKFDLLIYMNNHSPEVQNLNSQYERSPRNHIFTNHNLLCQLEIYCLGAQCNHYNWVYPSQHNIDNESQFNKMAKMIADNMIRNYGVYCDLEHDFIETEQGIMNSIGKLDRYNRVDPIKFVDANQKQREIKLYYQNQFLVGASTIDSAIELLYIREYLIKGKIVNPKVVQQIRQNDFSFYHNLFK